MRRWAPPLGLLLLSWACAPATASRSLPATRSACSGWRLPDDSPRERYPASAFVVGVGSASRVWDAARGREPAVAAALADLSRQLLSEVRAETTVARTADGASERQRVDDLASVRSDSLEVPGAEVVATCYDPDAATLHALVAVERAGLRRALLAERDGVRAEAARLQASIAGGAQSLEGVRRARRAVRLLERAERRSRVARALGGEPPATDPTLVELRRALNAMALRIGVAVEASASEPLRSELRAAVSRSGLPLCEPGSTEAALVALRLSLDRRSEAVAQMAGVTVVRARATVDLVRLDTGVVLSSLTHQETGSASTPGRAEALAAVALARWFAPRVEEALRRTDAEEALP